MGDPGRVLKNGAVIGNKGFFVHFRGPFPRFGRGVILLPMLCNLDAARGPDAVKALDIFNKFPQSLHAAGAPNQTAMQTNRHHFGLTCNTFGVKRIKAVFQIIVKLITCIKALRGGKTHVVGIQRVGDNQLVARTVTHPVRQIIGVRIRNVIKAAIFGNQPFGILRAAPRVPSARWLACDFGVQTDGFGHVGALAVFGAVFVFNPFQPVAGNFPTRILHRGNLHRRAGQGRGHAVNRDANIGRCEQPVQTPKTRARAVFIDALHI